jgi:hypothetical protein
MEHQHYHFLTLTTICRVIVQGYHDRLMFKHARVVPHLRLQCFCCMGKHRVQGIDVRLLWRAAWITMFGRTSQMWH